jgi:hypothetical protein
LLQAIAYIRPAPLSVTVNREAAVSSSNNLQTCPPDFGKARIVPRWWLSFAVRRRRSRAKQIISDFRSKSSFSPRKISIVILSCRRLPQLQRLVEGLSVFLEQIESYKNIEKILVDNGSGTELIEWAEQSHFFDSIIAHGNNLGMASALDDAFPRTNGEYILLLEEDFVVDYPKPFMQDSIDLFDEFPEIGIIRLKNKRNWGKSFRIIAPIRKTGSGVEFWTWLPSLNGKLNVWTAGSVLFRKASFISTGPIKAGLNRDRSHRLHQGALYEEVYGKKYNKDWLAAKMKDCYPFVQPDDHPESPGWGENIVSASESPDGYERPIGSKGRPER